MTFKETKELIQDGLTKKNNYLNETDIYKTKDAIFLELAILVWLLSENFYIPNSYDTFFILYISSGALIHFIYDCTTIGDTHKYSIKKFFEIKHYIFSTYSSVIILSNILSQIREPYFYLALSYFFINSFLSHVFDYFQESR